MPDTKPTAKQQQYLRSLAQRTATTFTPPKTKGQASTEIKRLKALGSSSRHERDEDRQAIAAAARGGAVAVRDEEITGHGSSATWGVGRATGNGS